MQILYRRWHHRKLDCSGMLWILAIGFLGACGSQTAPIDQGAGTTGRSRSRLDAHPVIGPEIRLARSSWDS